MKRLFYLLVAFSALALASCSSSDAPKDIKPTSTEFTSGELAKLIEVVDEPCQLSYVEKDGAVATQFIQLKIRLKLTKESPELQNIDARDINFIGLLSVATINLVDENGIKVQDLNVKSDDLLKLKKLLQGKKGDEETITFEGEFHNHDDAPKWFEQAAAFTPYLTGDVVKISSGLDIDGIHNMSGTVDKYPITMHLEIDGTIVKGSYYYDKQGSNAKLKLSGTNEDGILDINETNSEGVSTGHFKGKLSEGVFEGIFTTTEGKNLSFHVSKDDSSGESFSYESDDYFNDDFITGGGDVSVDEFLDEYEKFWRKYMNFIKKMDKNDPTAMIEYAQLLNEYNEYAQKLQEMKGEVSIDQLNRLNKMNSELLSEMQKIQK